MSKFKQLIPTLCVFSFVAILYYFYPSLTISLLLLSAFIYLYTDYESQQPNFRIHAGPVAALVRQKFTAIRLAVTNIMKKNQTTNIFTKPNSNINTNRSNMPSVESYSMKSRNSTTMSSCRDSPNLDENRLTSSRMYDFHNMNSSDGFNAMSPIRRDYHSITPRRVNTQEFKNLSIGDIRSTDHTPYRNFIGSMSSMSTAVWDSSSNMKQTGSGSATRNVQSFAGPLLASTRYNLSSDSALFADVNSPGLSSRVAKYGNDSLNSNLSATHQPQYCGPGQFPSVHLGKMSRLPVLSVRNSQKFSRSGMRTRTATPDTDERRSRFLSDRSQSLGEYASPTATKSVLDTLHELSRKRLHTQLGETDDEAVKKQRKSDVETPSMMDDSANQKRVREESSVDEDQQKKKTRSNEILSSLSSSRNLGIVDRPSKRKTSPANIPNGSTLMPAGKFPKKSMPIVDAVILPSTSKPIALCETGVQTEPDTLNPAPTLQSRTSPILGRGSRFADNAVDLPTLRKPLQVEETGEWLRQGFVQSTTQLELSQIKGKRELDTKNRLSEMMAVIGGKAETASKEASQSLSFGTSNQPPLVSLNALPTKVSAASEPEFPTNFNAKLTEKHVRFAENLTQVKSFDPSPSPSLESNPTITSSASSQPSITTFGLNSSSNSALSVAPVKSTSIAVTPPSEKPQLPTDVSTNVGFTLPSGTSLATSTVQGIGSFNNLKTIAATNDKPASFGTPITNPSPASLAKVSGNSAISFGGLPTVLPQTTSVFSFGASNSLPVLPTPSSISLGTITTPSTIRSQSITSPKTITPTQSFGAVSPSLATVVSQTTAPIMSTTFGQTPSSTGPVFGQTQPSTVASHFGLSFTSATAAPVQFGATTTSPAFGQVSTTGLGTTTAHSSAPKLTFGSSSVAMFGIGATASTASSFGSTATTLAEAKPQDSFGLLSKPEAPKLFGFGTVTSPQATSFGAQSAGNQSSFGVLTSPSQSGFGALNTQSQATFGTPTTQIQTGFGTPTTLSQNGFGAPTTQNQTGFGVLTTQNQSGFGTATSQSVVGFGMPTTQNQAVFGTSTTQGQVGFGMQTNTQASSFGQTGFGKAVSCPSPPPYGAAISTTTQQKAGFAFRSASTTSSQIGTTPVFGTKPDQQITLPSFGASGKSSSFQFNANPTPTTESKPAGFQFEMPQNSKTIPSLFGGFTGTSAEASSATPQSPFAFGSTAPKPFGFNDASAKTPMFRSVNTIPSIQTTSGNFGQNPFGGSHTQQPGVNASNLTQIPTQPKPTGLFSFGSASQPQQNSAPTGTFSFGSSTPASKSGGFAFGGAPSQEPQAGSTTFGFGGAATGQGAPTFGQATPAAGAFQFNAPPSTGPQGGFNFTASTTPSFGGGQTANAFQIGGAPQFGGAAPQQGSGMFSIGTGSSAPKGRQARPRRLPR